LSNCGDGLVTVIGRARGHFPLDVTVTDGETTRELVAILRRELVAGNRVDSGMLAGSFAEPGPSFLGPNRTPALNQHIGRARFSSLCRIRLLLGLFMAIPSRCRS
jgi:hypothetical protein